MLDGTYTKDTVFDPTDHRSHRRQAWLDASVKKVAALDFLTEESDATIGQIAIKFVLAQSRIASVLPTSSAKSSWWSSPGRHTRRTWSWRRWLA